MSPIEIGLLVVVNLKPRKMKFGVSEGMVLASGEEQRVTVASFRGDARPGDPVL